MDENKVSENWWNSMAHQVCTWARSIGVQIERITPKISILKIEVFFGSSAKMNTQPNPGPSKHMMVSLWTANNFHCVRRWNFGIEDTYIHTHKIIVAWYSSLFSIIFFSLFVRLFWLRIFFGFRQLKSCLFCIMTWPGYGHIPASIADETYFHFIYFNCQSFFWLRLSCAHPTLVLDYQKEINNIWGRVLSKWAHSKWFLIFHFAKFLFW